MESNELLIYDLQLKPENPAELAGTKIKITNNTKTFEMTQDLSAKLTKIKKIIYLILKSDQQ